MRLTKQYAYALLTSTPTENAYSIYQELVRIGKILNKTPEYSGFIDFQPEEFDSFRSMLGEEVNPIVVNFLEVLAEDGMLTQLDTVAEDYRLALVEEDLLFDVKVYSAESLSESREKHILGLIEARYGSDYLVDFRVDKTVLGGIKLEVNGAVIDTTFRSRIDHIIREVRYGAKR